eukprot:1929920-Rhodomonas_salina.1
MIRYSGDSDLLLLVCERDGAVLATVAVDLGPVLGSGEEGQRMRGGGRMEGGIQDERRKMSVGDERRRQEGCSMRREEKE